MTKRQHLTRLRNESVYPYVRTVVDFCAIVGIGLAFILAVGGVVAGKWMTSAGIVAGLVVYVITSAGREVSLMLVDIADISVSRSAESNPSPPAQEPVPVLSEVAKHQPMARRPWAGPVLVFVAGLLIAVIGGMVATVQYWMPWISSQEEGGMPQHQAMSSEKNDCAKIAENFYQYQDEDGNMVYTNRPSEHCAPE